MNHGAPRLAGDYPCNCPRCKPPDPERDWLTEALAIYNGSTRLLAQREHVVALIERMADLIAQLRDAKGGAARMIAERRAQAAAVANPVAREELQESLDVAEDVAAGSPRLFGVLPE